MFVGRRHILVVQSAVKFARCPSSFENGFDAYSGYFETTDNNLSSIPNNRLELDNECIGVIERSFYH